MAVAIFFQLNLIDLLIWFALLMVLLWMINFIVRLVRHRVKRPPKAFLAPKGYAGAQRLDYAKHPDTAIDRKKSDRSQGL
jgi:hypothetical protein